MEAVNSNTAIKNAFSELFFSLLREENVADLSSMKWFESTGGWEW